LLLFQLERVDIAQEQSKTLNVLEAFADGFSLFKDIKDTIFLFSTQMGTSEKYNGPI